MSTLWGLLITAAIISLASAFVIWIVGRLGLGLEVGGFGSAFIVAIAIAIVAGFVTLLLAAAGVQDSEGLIGGIAYLIISAVVLMISSRLLEGIRAASFVGVLAAAIAIGAVYWLGGLALALVVN